MTMEHRHRTRGRGFLGLRIVSLGASANRIRINTLALGARLPTMYGFRDMVEAGGLMSYGANYSDLFLRAGGYVDKIMRGSKPGDMPVIKFDLVLNLATAKALGLGRREARPWALWGFERGGSIGEERAARWVALVAEAGCCE
jgi:ABC transporter substrate binding protein